MAACSRDGYALPADGEELVAEHVDLHVSMQSVDGAGGRVGLPGVCVFDPRATPSSEGLAVDAASRRRRHSRQWGKGAQKEGEGGARRRGSGWEGGGVDLRQVGVDGKRPTAWQDQAGVIARGRRLPPSRHSRQ